jgi:hypothetical protein
MSVGQIENVRKENVSHHSTSSPLACAIPEDAKDKARNQGGGGGVVSPPLSLTSHIVLRWGDGRRNALFMLNLAEK